MASCLPGIGDSAVVCGKACCNEATGEARSSQGVSAASLMFHTALLLDDFRLRGVSTFIGRLGEVGRGCSNREKQIARGERYLSPQMLPDDPKKRWSAAQDAPHPPAGFAESPESWSKMPSHTCGYQEGLCVPMAHHACLGARILYG